jgi:hypothetical protein
MLGRAGADAAQAGVAAAQNPAERGAKSSGMQGFLALKSHWNFLLPDHLHQYPLGLSSK